MEPLGMQNRDSDGSGSGSSDEYVDQHYPATTPSNFDVEPFDATSTPATTATASSSPPPPSTAFTAQWIGTTGTRSRGSSLEGGQQRPSVPARTPSNTYAPQRRPPQYISLAPDPSSSSSIRPSTASTTTATSVKRSGRRDPNAQYQAQEKAYVQRIRANPRTWYNNPPLEAPTPSDLDLEDPSPSSELQLEEDSYDPDTHLFLADDNQPSLEELQNPKNQERLEWHSMLASVLKGDVVKQEKQRLIGSTEPKMSAALNNELWLETRAKVCGRSVALQRKLIEERRARLSLLIEDVINFEIKGEKETGKSPIRQVEDVVEKIGSFETLYPTSKEMEAANPRAASEEFCSSVAAVVAWHNTTISINTELAVLQSWVGNLELDFDKPRATPLSEDVSSDKASFLDRIMKEDGLKILQGDHNMLHGISEVIWKAKGTLIENAEAFAKRHLPPYIEELLTLINFPSRLIQEIIGVRLSYAKNMRGDPDQILVDQMISQFQILMTVAVEIKQRYLRISRPEPGWDLPPCVDENFDSVVLDAMRYYFRLLNWKLSANKNTFKEAEILEQEWGFSNEVGRQLDGGDIEVAEQFRCVQVFSYGFFFLTCLVH